MKQYKHLPTGKTYEHRGSNKYIYHEGSAIPLEIATQGKDWEEIKDDYIGERCNKVLSRMECLKCNYPFSEAAIADDGSEHYEVKSTFTNVDNDGEGNVLGTCSNCGCKGIVIQNHKCKPEWTILSFQSVSYRDIFYIQKKNGKFGNAAMGEVGSVDIQGMIELSKFRIYSIRRESDGEVFTIGDSISFLKGMEGIFKINRFIKENDNIYLSIDEAACHNLNSVDKVKSKEWEILSFIDSDNSVVYKFKKEKFDTYIIFNGLRYREQELLTNFKSFKIHSVKRLSDGVEFKIGDVIDSADWDNEHISKKHDKIKNIIVATKNQAKGFSFSEGDLVFQTEITWQTKIQTAIKLEKLFTTEDGVDIYEGEPYYVLSTKSWKSWQIKKATVVEPLGTVKAFSTEAIAKDYIIMNKPCLSVKDVMDIKTKYSCLGDTLVSEIKKFAQSKI